MRTVLAKTKKQIAANPLESLCDVFFVFYALWTLVWILAYFVNLTFSTLLIPFSILLPCSFLFLAFKPTPRNQGTPLTEKTAHRDKLLLLLFALTAVLLTLLLHRPDADDELFLGMALSLLANADQPLQSLPGYRSGTYAITAYEPLKAIVSYATGLPLLYSYYLLVPALTSALSVLVSFRLLRALASEGWIVGMLFFFVIMLAWGDVHRTHANFGFVRMFQGKSVLVSAIVPAILFYYLRFRSAARVPYSAWLLICAVVSGIGFSRGGIVIGPLLVSILTISSVKVDPSSQSLKPVLLAVFLSAVVVLPLVYYFGSIFNPRLLVHTQNGLVQTTTNLEMLRFTMGDGVRGVFLLLCVAASFLVVKDEGIRYLYRNYLAFFFLLLLIPLTSDFLAKTIHPFLSWRWMWIIPVPVLASAAIGSAVRQLQQMSNSLVAFCVFLTLSVTFVAVSPRRVISQENYTIIRWSTAKIEGGSIYLRPQKSSAQIRDARLYLEGDADGY